MRVNRENLLNKGNDYDLGIDYFMDNIKCDNDYPYTRINLSINKSKKAMLVNNKAGLDLALDNLGEAIVKICNESFIDSEEIEIIIDLVSGLTREELYALMGKDCDNDNVKEEKLGLVTRFKNYIKKFVR